MLIKLLESLLQTTTQRYVTIWSICVSLCYSTDYNISYIFNTTWGHSKDKIGRPVS